MNRRTFVTLTGLPCLAPLAAANPPAAAGRCHLQLQKYTLENTAQRQALDTFLRDAFVPACNRLGIRPVGVFEEDRELSPVYVLLPHPTLESAAALTDSLLSDPAFVERAGAFLTAPKAQKPFVEVESWLLHAFKGMPTLETPAKGPERVFQLRTYESPSVLTGRKKIEMFNDAGEIRIFRETGLTPVFFGEAVFGSRLPNLTYMLGFESAAAQQEAWNRFRNHPDWLRLRAMPEFADDRILRNIVNLQLKPAPYSQV